MWTLTKPAVAGAAPPLWARWQWVSYGRPKSHLACTDNRASVVDLHHPACGNTGGLDHTLGPSGFLCTAELSLLPASVLWSLSFSTTACTSRHAFWAGRCADMVAISASLSLPWLLASPHPYPPLKQTPGPSSTLFALADFPASEGDSQGKRPYPLSQLPHRFLLNSVVFILPGYVGSFLEVLVL